MTRAAPARNVSEESLGEVFKAIESDIKQMNVKKVSTKESCKFSESMSSMFCSSSDLFSGKSMNPFGNSRVRSLKREMSKTGLNCISEFGKDIPKFLSAPKWPGVKEEGPKEHHLDNVLTQALELNEWQDFSEQPVEDSSTERLSSIESAFNFEEKKDQSQEDKAKKHKNSKTLSKKSVKGCSDKSKRSSKKEGSADKEKRERKTSSKSAKSQPSPEKPSRRRGRSPERSTQEQQETSSNVIFDMEDDFEVTTSATSTTVNKRRQRRSASLGPARTFSNVAVAEPERSSVKKTEKSSTKTKSPKTRSNSICSSLRRLNKEAKKDELTRTSHSEPLRHSKTKSKSTKNISASPVKKTSASHGSSPRKSPRGVDELTKSSNHSLRRSRHKDATPSPVKQMSLRSIHGNGEDLNSTLHSQSSHGTSSSPNGSASCFKTDLLPKMPARRGSSDLNDMLDIFEEIAAAEKAEEAAATKVVDLPQSPQRTSRRAGRKPIGPSARKVKATRSSD